MYGSNGLNLKKGHLSKEEPMKKSIISNSVNAKINKMGILNFTYYYFLKTPFLSKGVYSLPINFIHFLKWFCRV